MRKVYGLIRTLGATSKYKGYYFVAEAVKLSMGFAEKPVRITKDVYPCLARKFKSTPVNVSMIYVPLLIYVGRTIVKRYRKLQVTL